MKVKLLKYTKGADAFARRLFDPAQFAVFARAAKRWENKTMQKMVRCKKRMQKMERCRRWSDAENGTMQKM
ncbi:MAG: hypothetical protein WB677_12250 [Xanthobacteraceae bacterium]